MKSDKKQSLVMIGIVLLIVAAITLYVTLSAPKVYENSEFSVASSTSETEKETVTITYPLNLNTATDEEIALLDGVSKKDAYAIVAYREEIGQYSDVSEIMNIKGIGKTLYERILPYVEV